ncbi:CYBB [Symbiodinium sp. CCMP2592]|nr:CYBB [Symbiodinium sp. CCMP2592]
MLCSSQSRLVRQRILAEVDFTCRALRGLTVFEFHERDVGENEGQEVLVHFPAHSRSCRARICCSHHRSACPPKAEDEAELKEHKVCSCWKSAADDSDTEPLASLADMGAPSWTAVDSDGSAVQVSGLEDLLSWQQDGVLALRLDGVLEAANADSDETLTSVEIAVQWVIEGEWLRPETSCNHFIRLPVHPRDAGGVSDGIGGSGEAETSADMDFFLAGLLVLFEGHQHPQQEGSSKSHSLPDAIRNSRGNWTTKRESGGTVQFEDIYNKPPHAQLPLLVSDLRISQGREARTAAVPHGAGSERPKSTKPPGRSKTRGLRHIPRVWVNFQFVGVREAFKAIDSHHVLQHLCREGQVLDGVRLPSAMASTQVQSFFMPGVPDEEEVDETPVTRIDIDDRVSAIIEKLGSVKCSSWDEVCRVLANLDDLDLCDDVLEPVMQASAAKLNFWADEELIASCCEVLKTRLQHPQSTVQKQCLDTEEPELCEASGGQAVTRRRSSKTSTGSRGSKSSTRSLCDSTSLAFKQVTTDAEVSTDIMKTSKAESKKENLILQDVAASRLAQFKYALWCFVTFQMVIFATYEFYYTTPKTWHLIGLPVPLARGFAYGACFWTGILFLTMSRDFLSLLARRPCVQRSQLLMQLINCQRELHIFSSWQVLLDSFVHTLAHHIGTFTALERSTAEELNKALVCARDPSELPAGYLGKAGLFLKSFQYPACPLPANADIGYFDGVFSTPGITGYLLLIVICLLGWASSAKVRHARFRLFYQLHHFLVPAWVILLVLHGANGWVGLGFPLVILVAGIPIVAYAWTRSRRAYLAWFCPSTLLTAEKSLNGKLVRIEVQLSSGYRRCNVGEYAYINIPSISRFEWHPFTISNSKDDERGGQLITFCIMSVGRWTQKLNDACTDGCAGHAFPRVNIDGPFYAPTVSMPLHSTVVGIGAGVGVTPFLSFLGSLAGSHISQERQHAHVFWMSAWATDFLLFKDLFAQLETQGGNTKCHLHATPRWDGRGLGCLFDLASRDIWNDWVRRLAARSSETVPTFCHYPKPLHAVVSGSTLESDTPLVIVIGRPDFVAELLAIGHADLREHVFVYCCGNDSLKEGIQTACVACNKHNESSGYMQRFYFYHGNYNASCGSRCGDAMAGTETLPKMQILDFRVSQRLWKACHGVESLASTDDLTCFKYREACPLAPHDVPLIVGPLAEEVYDKGRLMAPLGFQALLPQAARGAGAALRGVEEALGRALPLAACTSLFLPLPHLRPAAAPRLADAKSLGKAAASWDARPFGSSLPCFDIHGGIHFFDLSLLASSCPTLCSAVLRPVQAYAFATAWFGVSVRLDSDEHAWLFHGLCRLLSDSSLIHTWPSGLAEAEIAAKLREEGQLWHAQVEAGRDEQPLAAAVKDQPPFSPGSFAQLLGPVRELKAYLVCHELCRRLDWGNFHSRLAAIWEKAAMRCLTTTQFLELVGSVNQDFTSQWIYGLGCPVVRVGWFYNQALHRLELSASQLPLEPTPLQKPPALSHLTRRAGKTGVGFGYLGHASTAAAAQVTSVDPREAQKEINSSSSEVPFKYWTGTLVLDIYGKGSQTPGRVEIELTSADEVRTTSLLPPGVDQPALGRQEAELPPGLAFLVVGPQRMQWPLVRLEIAQPLDFWEGSVTKCGQTSDPADTVKTFLVKYQKSGMLRNSSAPAAEADAAKAIGDMLEAGQLPTGAAMSTLLQALSIPLKDEGWHEITCVECALTLCRWALKLQKGSALRSSLFRPLHEFFKSSRAAWQADTGVARVRMQVARCLQGRAFRTLELWRHCLPLELCYESSREDPLSIASLEIQRDVPHNSRSDVSGAIAKRLQLESALPSEGHHLAAATIRILLALCVRGQAEAAQRWDDFLVEVPSNKGPSPLREAYAKAWGVLGPAPSYLEAFAEAPRGGFLWSRAVRREACAASCQCGEAGEALEALSRVLDGDSVDGGGEWLQRAVWAGEAVLLRSPPGSQLTTSESASRQKWQTLRKQLIEDDRKPWPAFIAALRPTLALCRREASHSSQKARQKAPAGGAFWKTPGLFADIEPSHPQHATIAALKTPPAKAARVGDRGEATRAVTL